ncbi:MAG: SDR family NAD(P)-dependent oxidoreductase [Cyanobacteria bacterium SIG26]|nr:SDR family NAD(P)-dependent oxidoreductase [Cyanobacteria bacterium SIG26]
MKNIIITGSTSGIGKELVKLFAKNYKVYAAYRNKNLIEALENVEYFYMDMTNKKSIIEAANFIKSKTDKIDLLINVAGCVIAGPVETINTDNIREQFEVNTFSHIEFTQNLLPIMENSTIINISSMASFGQFPFISPYCASKRALDIFFNAFSIENHKNIKVISIKPGVIVTPLWSKSVDKNANIINNCTGYEKEMNFMKQNALKNQEKGLKVENVANKIYKIAHKKNPKTSYTIGFDAKIAELLSLLPQDLLNKIVKLGLNYRVNH